MPLKDHQILSMFTEHPALTDNNGRRCYVRLRENGVGQEQVCTGEATIENGKVKVFNTCGEPCEFVCKRTARFAETVEEIKLYDKLIELARQR